jgi:hypothetical protein
MTHKEAERAFADIWIEQIRACATKEELMEWATERSSKLSGSPHVDEIRTAYTARMGQLNGGGE